jgi:hypothetical protein
MQFAFFAANHRKLRNRQRCGRKNQQYGTRNNQLQKRHSSLLIISQFPKDVFASPARH